MGEEPSYNDFMEHLSEDLPGGWVLDSPAGWGGEEWIDSCMLLETLEALVNAENSWGWGESSASDVLTSAFIAWAFWEAQVDLRLAEAAS